MDEYLAAIDQELRALVVSPNPAYDAYYGMFRYHLGWTDSNLNELHVDTGKRLRPLLCLLSCQAAGGDWHTALAIAAAIELTHNFSLIHDDIEDRSDERRGRAAVWKVWGLAQGLNAGDGMFVLARLALDRLCERGLAPEKTCAISTVFDTATLLLCQGQFLDLGFESRDRVTIEEYFEMVRGKTAALISASTRIGATLGTNDEKVADAYAEFGENIGIAFQITDDILGIWGDPRLTGKSAATDILCKKKSLPTLYGLERLPALRALYQREQMTPTDVRNAVALLDSVDARGYAQGQADAYHAAALTALDRAPTKNRATDRLRELAALMTNRKR